jgi:hypothetical protein
MISTRPFRGLVHQSLRVSSQAKRNLSLTRLSLNSRSLLFYQRNVRPSVDLFTVPLITILHKARYQSIASDSLLPHDALIAPPYNSQYYVQSQRCGAHHHAYPKEPPNAPMTYNASVQSYSQSFTSSAYELAMPHCYPLLMNLALNGSTTSIDVPSSPPHINPSHFHLSHPSAATGGPVPQAPLNTPADTIDPSAPTIPVPNPGSSVASSSRAGPPRYVSSGVIACRQWCVIALPLYEPNVPLPKTHTFVNWAVFFLVGHARFAAILPAQIVKTVLNGATNAYMIKCPSGGGPISGLARANAPARSDNRMDLILSQRKSSVLIQSTRAPLPMPVTIILSMKSPPWPCRCLVPHNTSLARLALNPPPHLPHLQMPLHPTMGPTM